ARLSRQAGLRRDQHDPRDAHLVGLCGGLDRLGRLRGDLLLYRLAQSQQGDRRDRGRTGDSAMSGAALAATGFAVALGAMFLRMPIGATMLLTGLCGTWIITGSMVPALAALKTLTYDTFSSHSLSIIPLFLLMGQFATRSGLSESLFRAAADWVG